MINDELKMYTYPYTNIYIYICILLNKSAEAKRK